jgi:hypothetical protein
MGVVDSLMELNKNSNVSWLRQSEINDLVIAIYSFSEEEEEFFQGLLFIIVNTDGERIIDGLTRYTQWYDMSDGKKSRLWMLFAMWYILEDEEAEFYDKTLEILANGE